MTWRKTGSEFDDECADINLSDAAYRTHQEAIGFVYRIESDACTFAKSAVRRFATSDHSTTAIKELLDHGFWKDRDDRYEVVHHADVIRESLHAQAAKRDRDRAAQQRSRERRSKYQDPPPVSADVSADTRQTDRQTDRHLGAGMTQTCKHGVRGGSKPDSWFTDGMACSDCARERKGA